VSCGLGAASCELCVVICCEVWAVSCEWAVSAVSFNEL
jgi:hypothetical protein